MNKILQIIKAHLLRNAWLYFTVCLSLVLLVIFFGKVLFHANDVCFDANGDGIQAYYSGYYHLKHDHHFFHQENMNYPYGENVMFTACQPFVLFVLKIFGLEDYTIGAINLLMLFSIVASSGFIYLIFKEFKKEGIWTALMAVGIAFLSPQIHRLSGHFTLTYQFAIPAFIWLLLKFNKAPSYKRSLIIMAFVFLLASIHLYFLVFFLMIAVFYWLWFCITRRQGTYLSTFLFSIKHFSIQMISPYVLLQLLLFLTDNITDRTHNPSGILVYISNWTGTFFPYSYPLEPFFREYIADPAIVPSWEGSSYMGLFGTIMALFFALKIIRNLLNLHIKTLFRVSSIPLLNYFVVAGILALLYSFGYPFIFGHENWLEYLGPLKQMRGIARFAWLFFYVIHIAGIVYILSEVKRPLVKNGVSLLIVFLISFDAFNNINKYQDVLNNPMPDMRNKTNDTPDYLWLKSTDLSAYQAIIPLPYFHIGSENIGIAPKGTVRKWAYVVSMKTGWPLFASFYSRTSMGQTKENVQFALEPNRIPLWVKDLPNAKPFLIICDKDEELLNPNEKALVKKAALVSHCPEYSAYKLTKDSLLSLYAPQFKMAEKELEVYASRDTIKSEYIYSGTRTGIVMRSFDKMGGTGFLGQGLVGYAKEYTILFEEAIPGACADSTYKATAWVNNIGGDLYPRSLFFIQINDSLGVFKTSIIYDNVNSYLRRTDNNWGMIEGSFKLEKKSDIVKFGFFNGDLKEGSINEFDELLILPEKTVIMKKINDSTIYRNNRLIHRLN